MCIIFLGIIILSFQSNQTRILSADLGMARNRYGLSCKWYYLQICKNVQGLGAGAGWFWLLGAGAGWFWLLGAGAGWFWLLGAGARAYLQTCMCLVESICPALLGAWTTIHLIKFNTWLKKGSVQRFVHYEHHLSIPLYTVHTQLIIDHLSCCLLKEFHY